MSRPLPERILRPVLASFGQAPFLARDAASRCTLDRDLGLTEEERAAACAAAIEAFARRHPHLLERIPHPGGPPLWRVQGPLLEPAPGSEPGSGG